MSKILLEKYKNINNKKLLELLEKVNKESKFLEDNQRLLSEDEILNYNDELKIAIQNIIPLIDFCDNDFLVYEELEKKFKMFNIIDELFYENLKITSKYN